MDVRSLYSNIRHEDGIAALKKSLDNRATKTPDTEVLVTLMEHILTLNSFTFNNKHYLQTKGCAMGTVAAPPYAIIYMGDFEETHIYPYINDDCPFYARYIDDILFIYTGGQAKLENFFRHINSVHDSIKFDYTTSLNSIAFLDTLIYIDINRKLQTTLYVKPTDSHNFLHAKSAHPKHLIKNLPYSQALRIRRICSDDNELERHNQALIKQFLARGYPNDLITSQIAKARHTPREQTLTLTRKKESNRIPLITTFQEGLPPLARILRNRWDILTLKDDFKDIFLEPGLVSYRRPPNIRDLVCSNTIMNDKVSHKNQTLLTPKTCTPCTSKRCFCCKQISSTDSFTSTTTKKTFTIFHESNCKSSYVVYLLECTRCNLQYVGKSEWPFHKRVNQYRHRINSDNTNTLLPIEKHFKSGHNFDKDGTFTIIEKIEKFNSPNVSKILQRRENFWILKLCTLQPQGLNTKLNPLH